jgi:3-oxoacyl-[acyl-carrier-protein] synthase II
LDERRRLPLTTPSVGGEGAARCMKTIRDAGLNADAVDYINARHVNASRRCGRNPGDESCLGDHAYKVAVSSTKSMIGHLLGAAGGIEAVLTALSIKNQIAPPTINLENQDPECDLDYVPNTARNMKIDVAMSNSFGFGGH